MTHDVTKICQEEIERALNSGEITEPYIIPHITDFLVKKGYYNIFIGNKRKFTKLGKPYKRSVFNDFITAEKEL